MDKIDELISRAQEAVMNNEEGDGLGVIDWSLLTESEKKKFNKHFLAVGEDESIFNIDGREFSVKIINYE